MTLFTSKVEEAKERREGEPTETLVEVVPSEYSELRVNSLVDCNSIKRMTFDEFVQKNKSDEVTNCDALSEELVATIVTGVKKSRLVAQDIKDLL